MYKLSPHFVAFSQLPPVRQEYSDAVKSIIALLVNGWNAPTDLKQILEVNHIGVVENLKMEALDMLVAYAWYILEDHHINEVEYADFIALKRVFKVKEGDFFKFRQSELQDILRVQFYKIYSDDRVDTIEALTKVNLQSLFDLSYEQFERFKQDNVIFSLLKGADPLQLDIANVSKDWLHKWPRK